jgi:hypothetical protein
MKWRFHAKNQVRISQSNSAAGPLPSGTRFRCRPLGSIASKGLISVAFPAPTARFWVTKTGFSPADRGNGALFQAAE